MSKTLLFKSGFTGLIFILGVAMPFLGVVNSLLVMMLVGGMSIPSGAVFIPVAINWVLWFFVGDCFGRIVIEPRVTSYNPQPLNAYIVVSSLYLIGVLMSLGFFFHIFDSGYNIFDMNGYKIDPDESDAIGLLTLLPWLGPIAVFWLGASIPCLKEAYSTRESKASQD